MSYDFKSHLWDNGDEHYYRDRGLQPVLQEGPHCVSTALSILVGKRAEHFLGLQKEGKLNTQDPVSWSLALNPFGMKLAYIPFDVRKLQFYMDELVGLDDLFLLCYYCGPGSEMLKDPNPRGWVCGSHVVVLHRALILDPARGESVYAFEHQCNGCHTKRLFRVVPESHRRGL